MTVMKLLRPCSASNAGGYQFGLSRGLRALLYSTDTVSASSSEDTLYGRLLPHGSPSVSLEPILDQWVAEGRGVEQKDLHFIIERFRRLKRLKHALEVSEWMSNKRSVDLSAVDLADRLELISKVHGLEQSEKYFENIPVTMRGLRVYGALLNCYTDAKSLEKAEATMQKIREIGFASRSSLHYTLMIKLYTDMGQHEKLDSLIQEMEEDGIASDKLLSNTLLNAYATASDFEGMEKLLRKMEADPAITMDWQAYGVAANCYLGAGSIEKAMPLLKKSEQQVKGRFRRFSYEVLLTLWARAGAKDEVYRMWNLCKSAGKVNATSYINVISSLVKLDDLGGAEKIYEEWEAEKSSFDFRVPNILFCAYCKKCLLQNAESILKTIIDSGEEPNPSVWKRLAGAYCEDGQFEKAVETMKKAIMISPSGRNIPPTTLAACLEYLRGKGNIKVAEELVELLRGKSKISTEVCDRFASYIESGNPAFLARILGGGNDDQELEVERGLEL